MGDTVQRWTGHEARLLRLAMRLTQRQFAELLDVSERAVGKWERGGSEYEQRPLTQGLLDTALARTDDGARARFVAAFGTGHIAAQDGSAADRLDVEWHKFLPVFVGPELAARLAQIVGAPATDSWLDVSVTPVSFDEDETCSLYLSACGVALAHLVRTPPATSLRDLAGLRHVSHQADPGRVAALLAEALGTDEIARLVPDYVFSAYWLRRSPWTGPHLESAMHLMSSLSMLIDRRDNAGQPVNVDVEEQMIASGFEHPDAVPVGLSGISTGYATWSGVAYHPLDTHRSLTVEDLIGLEITTQIMWCYARHVQAAVEEGHAPGIDERYGWRFLRAARTRLGTPRADEWSQVRTLREAIVTSSGLDELLLGAQNALRDDATDIPATYRLVRDDAGRDTRTTLP